MKPGDTALTTNRTIVRGEANGLGWKPLLANAGERHSDCLCGFQAGDGATGLATILHLSDLHVCDAESPARLEYLDRLADPDSPIRDALGEVGTYRPQEILTVQVAVAMVRAANRLTHGPVSGRPVDTVLITGDVTDNAQANELDWYQRVLEGGAVTPASGDASASSWVGSRSAPWDERYWHPDGPPADTAPDRPTRIYGYPLAPGLVEAARRTVLSPGLRQPWITVHGNHDALLQGTVAANNDLRALAVGDSRITGVPHGFEPMRAADAIAQEGPAAYIHDASSPRHHVPSDSTRAIVNQGDFAQRTRPSAGPDPVNYFACDIGAIRLISLDTVNPHGGWQGSLDEEQFAWLRHEMDAHPDKYIVIASHHPSPTLINGYVPDGLPARILGGEIVQELLKRPQVIAWIAGHVHFHAAMRHGTETSGFWEITTSSLIDWPQQGRMVEFVRKDTDVPQIAIISTVIDHDGPIDWGREEPFGQGEGEVTDAELLRMASLSRTLAANDYRTRSQPSRRDGTSYVRNQVWCLPDPFAAVT